MGEILVRKEKKGDNVKILCYGKEHYALDERENANSDKLA